MEVITHRKHAENVAGWERWASAVGGAALVAYGSSRRSAAGWGLAALGGELVRRGITGHSYLYQTLGTRTAPLGQGAQTTSLPYELGVRVDRSITVNKPREEVYRFWRNIENLARFMQHVESIKAIDGKRSHWCVKGPAGKSVSWDAEINNEIENELIGWRSLSGSDVQNAGSVQFKDAPAGRGTEVIVELQYNPPAGLLGALAAKMWGEEPGQQIQEDLRRFKQIMEAGEVPTTEGQPQGSTHNGRERRMDTVQKASEDSFPASDAPAWRGAR